MNWSEICERVYQSGAIQDESDWQIIREQASKLGRPVAILDMQAEREDTPANWPVGWMVLWMNIPDSDFEVPGLVTNTTTLKAFFRTAGEIAAHLYNAGYIVWFHCAAGVSRATTANSVFRMIQFKETRDQALEVIRKARPIINPNPFFMNVLGEIDGDLRNE